MNDEGSREPERYKHCWQLPTGFKRENAIDYFVRRVKPRNYEFDVFKYNSVTGVAETW